MITKIPYSPPIVELYSPKDELIMVLFNGEEFNQIRLQITKHNLSGYYIVFNDKRYEFNNNGCLIDYPIGLYDAELESSIELLKFNIEKNKKK